MPDHHPPTAHPNPPHGEGHDGHVHHHGPSVLTVTPGEMQRDAISSMVAGPGFWTLVLVLGILFAVGLVGLAIRASEGLENRPAWGYTSALLGWFFITVQSAPLVALGLRFNKSDWRRPITRISELFAVTGLVTMLMFAVLVLTLPTIFGRLTIWFNWPVGAPELYDTIAVLFTVFTGFAALYFSALPDFAVIRDRATGATRDRYERWALGWRGTTRQWKVLQFGLIFLGSLYALMIVFVHMLYLSDFGMGLVPGWRSAILPGFYTLTGFQCAIATTIIAAFLWRKVGGLGEYIRLDQFWALAKLLLATSLLWFYFFFSDFITHWYGRTPREIEVLQLLMTGPYLWAFVLAFGLSFIVPWWTLIFNKIRVSILGPTIIAISVLIGNYFNSVRWFVSARSTADQLFAAEVLEPAVETFGEGHIVHDLAFIPPTLLPDIIDLLIYVGMIAGVLMVYLLAAKVFPSMSIWEMKQGMLLRTTRRYARGRFVVIGKPT